MKETLQIKLVPISLFPPFPIPKNITETAFKYGIYATVERNIIVDSYHYDFRSFVFQNCLCFLRKKNLFQTLAKPLVQTSEMLAVDAFSCENSIYPLPHSKHTILSKKLSNLVGTRYLIPFITHYIQNEKDKPS